MEIYSSGRESDGVVLLFNKALLKDYYLDYYFLEARMINISSPLFFISHYINIDLLKAAESLDNSLEKDSRLLYILVVAKLKRKSIFAN
jgi:hypothetical protein